MEKTQMYTVEKLFQEHGEALSLALEAGKKGIKRRITVPEAHRPGLFLAGYKKARASKRIIVLGRAEINYLRDLDAKTRLERLEALLEKPTPAVIVTRNARIPREITALCNGKQIPLMKTPLRTMHLLSRLAHLLNEEFTPRFTCHGTLVEVFGMGLLIRGDSSVGKSESALGLVERGHRLVSDDIVHVRKRENSYVEGYGAELTRHHMEIRGIGIINVANIYGAVCVRESKRIDLVVQIEEWDDSHFYDRIGLDESFTSLLDIRLPYLVLPVKPGRDVVLLLETIALNQRLKGMGYHSAKEFTKKFEELSRAKEKKEQRARKRRVHAD